MQQSEIKKTNQIYQGNLRKQWHRIYTQKLQLFNLSLCFPFTFLFISTTSYSQQLHSVTEHWYYSNFHLEIERDDGGFAVFFVGVQCPLHVVECSKHIACDHI